MNSVYTYRVNMIRLYAIFIAVWKERSNKTLGAEFSKTALALTAYLEPFTVRTVPG